MKKIIISLMLILTSGNTMGQIYLEHTYDSCAIGPYLTGFLMMVNLENSGYRYIKYNADQNKVIVYLLNHTIEKEFQLPVTPNTANNENFSLLYFSESLFKTDNLMEYMLVRQGWNAGNFYCSTHIANENGTVLFYGGGEAPFVEAHWHQQQYPIYNTSSGTKLLMSKPNTKQVKVYSLQGVLTTSMMPEPVDNEKISNIYPNPAINDITIEYQLPQGSNSGKIRIYAETGQFIKEYKIDSTFNSIILPNNDFKAGTYFYEIVTENKIYKGSQFSILN